VNYNGIKYMDTGENVGRSVRLVEKGNHIGKYIFLRVYYRAKIRTVLIKGTDNKANGHTCKKVGAHPVIILPVLKKEIQDEPAHIKKPEVIRDNKILIKRNEIIGPSVYNMIIRGYGFFQIHKPRQINKCIR
jgi:hypothetical protein